MTDRFSKAIEELNEKNAFVCISCNAAEGVHEIPHAELHALKTTDIHDRFSRAIEELGEKNAYVCDSCNQKLGFHRKARAS